MGKSTFGQMSGALNNGGKFYTSEAIEVMEIEMPGGLPGYSETLLVNMGDTVALLSGALVAAQAAYTASAAAYTASLAKATSGSDVITAMIGDAAGMAAVAAGVSSSINAYSVAYLSGI